MKRPITPHLLRWADIPPIRILPEGRWTLRIDAFHEQESDFGILEYVMERSTTWPVPGLLDHEAYQIGTPTDPHADTPITWARSVGLTRLKQTLYVAGVSEVALHEVEISTVLASAIGHTFDVECSHVTDDGEIEPRNRGRIYRRLSLFRAGVFESLERMKEQQQRERQTREKQRAKEKKA